VLLQSTVVFDHKKRPSFKRLDDPPPIPVVELEPPDATADERGAEAGKARSGEEASEEECRAEDQRILARELNTGFEGAQSLLRCTVIQPSAPSIQRSRSLGDTGASRVRPRVRYAPPPSVVCVRVCRVCRVVSCRVVSCRVVSCRVVSCRVVSCRVCVCVSGDRVLRRVETTDW
jgi:hypothetical protein